MMHSADRQVLAAVRRWADTGHRFALVTVVRTWGSAPRPVGSWMALREDGQVQGSVSGGCVEADLIGRVKRAGFKASTPFLLQYGVTKEEANRYGLPCGGTMELVVEPCPDPSDLCTLFDWISLGRVMQRTITVGEQRVLLTAASAKEPVTWDGRTLNSVHGPAWRLLIVGAGQTSSYLASMAQALDYQVYVCDPRTEYSRQWDVDGTVLLSCMPDDAVLELGLDAHSAVVALTHDPKLDDMVLLEALKSPAFYVGALGSAANSERRRERLFQHFDLTRAEVDRLHGPVGLPIGSHTPPEIAVAVLAEMTAVRNGVWTKAGFISKPKGAFRPGGGARSD